MSVKQRRTDKITGWKDSVLGDPSPRYRDSGILEMGLEEFIPVGDLILILVHLGLDQLSQLQTLSQERLHEIGTHSSIRRLKWMASAT
jgi:hypothetical protein